MIFVYIPIISQTVSVDLMLFQFVHFRNIMYVI